MYSWLYDINIISSTWITHTIVFKSHKLQYDGKKAWASDLLEGDLHLSSRGGHWPPFINHFVCGRPWGNARHLKSLICLCVCGCHGGGVGSEEQINPPDSPINRRAAGPLTLPQMSAGYHRDVSSPAPRIVHALKIPRHRLAWRDLKGSRRAIDTVRGVGEAEGEWCVHNGLVTEAWREGNGVFTDTAGQIAIARPIVGVPALRQCADCPFAHHKFTDPFFFFFLAT